MAYRILLRRGEWDVDRFFATIPAGKWEELKIAHAIIADGRLAAFVKERYRSWDSELGRRIESGQASLADLEAYIIPKGDAAKNASGRQEMLENLINEFI